MKKQVWQEAYEKVNPDPSKMDGIGEKKALDVMLSEREKETNFSKKARDWEKDRKKEWQQNVPEMRKRDMEAKEAPNPYLQAMNEIKEGGMYQTSVHPIGGYMLSTLEKIEKRTASGIVLPDKAEEEPNTARVLEVGKGYVAESGTFISTEVLAGQLVLFRKYAGMNIEIKGNKYLLLHFTDIIATIDDN